MPAWTKASVRFQFAIALLLVAGTLSAQEADPYKIKPRGHEENFQAVRQAHETNLKRLGADTNFFLRPGLIADKRQQRVEVKVERSTVGKNSPCEFTVIAESSDHGYEALFIAFAKPSDVQQALQFLGTEPGATYDPAALRFWAKGETFLLSVARSNAAPIRLEQLMVDRRTGKSLREAGFIFGGSRIEPSRDDPRKRVYVADVLQPKSIVSLFNATDSVLDVPYFARKEDVYQNTIINPAYEFPEGTLLTLIIEAANKDGSKRVKDLALIVESGASGADAPAGATAALVGLRVQLKDGVSILNEQPTLLGAVEKLATLDRMKHDYYLSVQFAENVTLAQVQAAAKVLAIIDSDKGVRIEPPASGQLFYRAFTPDQKSLNRAARLDHPWELSLAETDGRLAGRLLLVSSVWKDGASHSELEFSERAVFGGSDLRKELDAELAQGLQANRRLKPEVILVFAPSTLRYGQLQKFLETALPTHRSIHVFLDEPMPPVPAKKQSP